MFTMNCFVYQMIENFVIIFKTLFSLESDVPTNCPSQWWPYAGHCYKIHREEKKIQRDALTACRKEGGDLASIHSIEEFDFIISQLGYGEKSTTVIHFPLSPTLHPSLEFNHYPFNYKCYDLIVLI